MVTTEILGLFIIIGAAIVLILKHRMKKQQTEMAKAEMEVSAAELRSRLEHSADEIIAALASHVDELEKLIVEADKRAAMLDTRLRELQRMVPPERTDAVEFSELLDQSIKNERYVSTSPVSQKAQQYQVQSVGNRVYQQSLKNEVTASDTGMQDASRAEFHVIQQKPQAQTTSPTDENMTKKAEAEKPENHAHSRREREESPNMKKVREMIMSGASDEEIVRETNLGKGAITLMRQMLH